MNISNFLHDNLLPQSVEDFRVTFNRAERVHNLANKFIDYADKFLSFCDERGMDADKYRVEMTNGTIEITPRGWFHSRSNRKTWNELNHCIGLVNESGEDVSPEVHGSHHLSISDLKKNATYAGKFLTLDDGSQDESKNKGIPNVISNKDNKGGDGRDGSGSSVEESPFNLITNIQGANNTEKGGDPSWVVSPGNVAVHLAPDKYMDNKALFINKLEKLSKMARCGHFGDKVYLSTGNESSIYTMGVDCPSNEDRLLSDKDTRDKLNDYLASISGGNVQIPYKTGAVTIADLLKVAEDLKKGDSGKSLDSLKSEEKSKNESEGSVEDRNKKADEGKKANEDKKADEDKKANEDKKADGSSKVDDAGKGKLNISVNHSKNPQADDEGQALFGPDSIYEAELSNKEKGGVSKIYIKVKSNRYGHKVKFPINSNKEIIDHSGIWLTKEDQEVLQGIYDKKRVEKGREAGLTEEEKGVRDNVFSQISERIRDFEQKGYIDAFHVQYDKVRKLQKDLYKFQKVEFEVRSRLPLSQVKEIKETKIVDYMARFKFGNAKSLGGKKVVKWSEWDNNKAKTYKDAYRELSTMADKWVRRRREEKK